MARQHQIAEADILRPVRQMQYSPEAISTKKFYGISPQCPSQFLS